MPAPSSRLVAALALGTLPALASALWPAAAALWLAYLALVALAAAADWLARPSPAAIAARREVPSRMVLGRPQAAAVLASLSRGPAITLWVKDSWPSGIEGERTKGPVRLGPGREARIDFEMTPKSRGAHRLGDLHLRYTGPLGLWVHRKAVPAAAQVSVYPRFAPSARGLLAVPWLGVEGIRRTPQRGEGTDFESLRDYGPDDGAARIDWKATARRGRAVSRQFTVEKNHDLILALDAGRLMGARFGGLSKLDHALHALLPLAEAGLRLGDRVGAMAFAAGVSRFVPPGKGPGHLGRILEGLHDVHSGFAETDFARALDFLAERHRKRALVVLFTDFIDLHTALPMVEGLFGLARRHAVLFVAVEDPTVSEVLDRPPAHPRDAFEKAVAFRLRRERQEVLEILKRRGISVLNALPDALAAPVINRYLQLRFRGLA